MYDESGLFAEVARVGLYPSRNLLDRSRSPAEGGVALSMVCQRASQPPPRAEQAHGDRPRADPEDGGELLPAQALPRHQQKQFLVGLIVGDPSALTTPRSTSLAASAPPVASASCVNRSTRAAVRRWPRWRFASTKRATPSNHGSGSAGASDRRLQATRNTSATRSSASLVPSRRRANANTTPACSEYKARKPRSSTTKKCPAPPGPLHPSAHTALSEQSGCRTTPPTAGKIDHELPALDVAAFPNATDPAVRAETPIPRKARISLRGSRCLSGGESGCRRLAERGNAIAAGFQPALAFAPRLA